MRVSKELRINPNTAHKIVMQLVREGLLEVLVGQGTVVSTRPTPGVTERSRLLRDEMEKLVVEAKKLGMELDDVLSGVERYWRRLGDGEQLVGARGDGENS
jgi:GntR family transcriptional regulator